MRATDQNASICAELRATCQRLFRSRNEVDPPSEQEYEMDTKDQGKYGVGRGLTGRRYVWAANRKLDAAAMVSFVGTPNLKDEDLAELQKNSRIHRPSPRGGSPAEAL